MKGLLIIASIFLVGCASEMTTDQVNSVSRLHARCTIEYAPIIEESEEITNDFCTCLLKSSAVYRGVDELGFEKAFSILTKNYKITTDLARAIRSGDQKIYGRFPESELTKAAKRVDFCTDEAKENSYEQDIQEKVNGKMGV